MVVDTGDSCKHFTNLVMTSQHCNFQIDAPDLFARDFPHNIGRFALIELVWLEEPFTLFEIFVWLRVRCWVDAIW